MLNHLIDPEDESDYVACYQCGGAVHVDKCYENGPEVYCQECAELALCDGAGWIIDQVSADLAGMIKALEEVLR